MVAQANKSRAGATARSPTRRASPPHLRVKTRLAHTTKGGSSSPSQSRSASPSAGSPDSGGRRKVHSLKTGSSSSLRLPKATVRGLKKLNSRPFTTSKSTPQLHSHKWKKRPFTSQTGKYSRVEDKETVRVPVTTGIQVDNIFRNELGIDVSHGYENYITQRRSLEVAIMTQQATATARAKSRQTTRRKVVEHIYQNNESKQIDFQSTCAAMHVARAQCDLKRGYMEAEKDALAKHRANERHHRAALITAKHDLALVERATGCDAAIQVSRKDADKAKALLAQDNFERQQLFNIHTTPLPLELFVEQDDKGDHMKPVQIPPKATQIPITLHPLRDPNEVVRARFIQPNYPGPLNELQLRVPTKPPELLEDPKRHSKDSPGRKPTYVDFSSFNPFDQEQAGRGPQVRASATITPAGSTNHPSTNHLNTPQSFQNLQVSSARQSLSHTRQPVIAETTTIGGSTAKQAKLSSRTYLNPLAAPDLRVRRQKVGGELKQIQKDFENLFLHGTPVTSGDVPLSPRWVARRPMLEERGPDFITEKWLLKRSMPLKKKVDAAAKRRYRIMFNVLDQDGGAELDLQELLDAMKYCGLKVNKDELIEMMKSVDHNFDGKVTFHEFVNGYAAVSEWDTLFALQQARKEKQARDEMTHKLDPLMPVVLWVPAFQRLKKLDDSMDLKRFKKIKPTVLAGLEERGRMNGTKTLHSTWQDLRRKLAADAFNKERPASPGSPSQRSQRSKPEPETDSDDDIYDRRDDDGNLNSARSVFISQQANGLLDQRHQQPTTKGDVPTAGK